MVGYIRNAAVLYRNPAFADTYKKQMICGRFFIEKVNFCQKHLLCNTYRTKGKMVNMGGDGVSGQVDGADITQWPWLFLTYCISEPEKQMFIIFNFRCARLCFSQHLYPRHYEICWKVLTVVCLINISTVSCNKRGSTWSNKRAELILVMHKSNNCLGNI